MNGLLLSMPDELNPAVYASSYAIEQLGHEQDICGQLFIVQHSGLYYADSMENRPGLASKNSLVMWLNDATRKSETVRDGIVTQYMNAYPYHFTQDRKWKARHFPEYVYFVLDLLTNKSYTGKRSTLFAESVRDDVWFWQMASLSGLKLVELLYDTNSLTSVAARAQIKMIRFGRQMMDHQGKMFGGFAKRGCADIDQFRSDINPMIAGMIRCNMESLKQETEYACFKKHENEWLKKSLMLARDRCIGSVASMGNSAKRICMKSGA